MNGWRNEDARGRRRGGEGETSPTGSLMNGRRCEESRSSTARNFLGLLWMDGWRNVDDDAEEKEGNVLQKERRQKRAMEALKRCLFLLNAL